MFWGGRSKKSEKLNRKGILVMEVKGGHYSGKTRKPMLSRKMMENMPLEHERSLLRDQIKGVVTIRGNFKRQGSGNKRRGYLRKLALK